ncbi:hypothetical protein EV127DRAFT_436209 [Xylaria flabelliformis]|nr:hypothetical protein EV127DRAFT_436209 [Xylaria flabelliformis]
MQGRVRTCSVWNTSLISMIKMTPPTLIGPCSRKSKKETTLNQHRYMTGKIWVTMIGPLILILMYLRPKTLIQWKSILPTKEKGSLKDSNLNFLSNGGKLRRRRVSWAVGSWLNSPLRFNRCRKNLALISLPMNQKRNFLNLHQMIQGLSLMKQRSV